ncbi:BTB And C-terminal Kelch family protein [Acanthocheilonema viteae]
MPEPSKPKSEKIRKIIFHSHRDDFAIDIDLLKEHSKKIKQLEQDGKVPKRLDLSNYDVVAVATLVDYMANGGNTKARITSSILGDMTEIARILEMETLLKKIEEFILISVTQNEQFLVHILTMICMQILLDTSLGKKVIDIAVNKFPIIRKLASFNDVPLDAILRILDRCDLNINSEYDVVETGISWLAAKPERVHFSHLVLRCIRVVNLTPDQRFDLFALTDTMSNYAQIVLCVLTEHNSYKRCGNRNGNAQFLITVPSRKIVYRRKAPPIKASYVTAKPKSSPSQATDNKKSEAHSEGRDLRRSIFGLAQKRRTTRAERMAEYMKDQKQKKEIVNKKATNEMKISKDESSNTTKSSKNKQSRKQRETAGSSPDSKESSIYFKSSDNRSIAIFNNKASNETDQTSSSTSIDESEQLNDKQND